MTSLGRALLVLAAIPVITGAVTVLGGSATIPRAGEPAPAVESELRFYAVWWIGAGIYLASLAPRVQERGRELRAVCALLFAGGLARVLAMLDAGAPHPLFVVLMGAELVLAVVLVAWQARVARAAAGVAGAAYGGTGRG
ncbi:MAG TPA: DUF4345 domain-containing protein [Solirubrobacteraceae bacterium]|nr:DUF4345 domain-containing protein [Solirubrobacteraceae bacterium]